jgi:hypothetical protein
MAKLEEWQLQELFEDFLDDCAEPFNLFGMEYMPSYILRECDPIAFRVTFSDWLDGLEDCEDCAKNPQECECAE